MTATAKKSRREIGSTYYSEKIEGDAGNYYWLARFDVTDGYVGITQLEGTHVKDRVLLSSEQFRALVAFVKRVKHGA